jgi:hypothetical protein
MPKGARLQETFYHTIIKELNQITCINLGNDKWICTSGRWISNRGML